MYNDEFLESLTEEELKVLFWDPDNIEVLLDPIKKAPRGSYYRQFDKYLGTKDKKSTVVQKFLPKITMELYEDRDLNYVKVVQMIGERYSRELEGFYQTIYGKEFSAEEVGSFTAENYIDFITKHLSEPDTSIDLAVFWIQLKLSGVEPEETVKKEVSDWYKENYQIQEPEKEALEEDMPNNEEPNSDQVETRKKITKSSKKSLTPAEKEAKRKAEAKKKREEEKLLEEQQKEIHKEEEKKETSESVFQNEELSKTDTDGKNILITSDFEGKESYMMTNQDTKKIHAYIGTVNVTNGPTNLDFYNFNPIGELNGKEFTAFYEHELGMIFPDSNFRNILLYYTSDQTSFVDPKLKDGMLIALEYEVDEMDANLSTNTGERNNTGYKVKFVEGYNAGRIKNLWKYGFYTIRSADILQDDLGLRKFVRIEDKDLMDGEEFFLEIEKDTVVGPFTAVYKPTLESFVIETDVANNNYLLDGYSKSSLISTCFERTFSKGPLSMFRYYCYRIPEKCEPKKIDVISDKVLLEAFSAELKQHGASSVELNQLPSYIESMSNIFAGEGIPAEISKGRQEKLLHLLSIAAENQESQDAILDVICDVLVNSKDNEKVDELIRALFRKDSFVENIQSIKYLREQIESLKSEKDSLQDEKKEAELKKDFDERRKNEDYRLSEEYQKKKEELERIEKKIEEYKNAEKLSKTHEQLVEDVAYLTKHKENLTSDVKDLEFSFTKMINDSSAKMADVTFDGFVSSKMIEAASKWDDEQRAKNYEAMVDAMSRIQASDLSENDLIEYLVNMIQISRPHYSRNMIINLMICTTQGMLTVFAGPPGCGKTSICNIISKVLGTRDQKNIEIDGVSVKPNRFVQVSVERGWTSKRDFIGYYNPLTKTFEENNHEVFDGLKLLNTEARKGIHGLPYIILLDEANLSPMEYYWADFMNVCDDLESNHSINLGNNNIFEIPETLHFLATINNDHTTETLSPRLIDRAWVVTLPQEKSYIPGKEIPEDRIETIAWENLKNLFAEYEEEELEFSSDIQIVYDEIKKKLSDIGPALSIRTDKLIRRYCAVASRLMEDNTEVAYSSEIIALDYAISQKVLPKISGNGDDFEIWLTEFRDYAKKNYLNNSAAILNRILENGKRQMKFFQFFN